MLPKLIMQEKGSRGRETWHFKKLLNCSLDDKEEDSSRQLVRRGYNLRYNDIIRKSDMILRQRRSKRVTNTNSIDIMRERGKKIIFIQSVMFYQSEWGCFNRNDTTSNCYSLWKNDVYARSVATAVILMMFSFCLTSCTQRITLTQMIKHFNEDIPVH